MKSQLASKLKELLDNMSQEEFDKQWSEITSLGLEGPSFADVFEFDAAHFQVNYNLPAEVDAGGYNEISNSYLLAA